VDAERFMLSFVVFDAEGVDAAHFPPRHAYLVGTDEIPTQGTVTLGSGLVGCDPSQAQTAGLAVQMPLARPDGSGSLGLMTIQTCLLPSRERPYLLTIELARHRTMLFLNKLEDWGLMADIPGDHPVMLQFEEARRSFTRALVGQRDTDGEVRSGYAVGADHQAGRAISLSVAAGEGLAMYQAERQLKSRVSGQAYKEAGAHLARLTPEIPPAGAPILVPGAGQVVLPGVAQIGCAVSPGQFTEPQQRALAAGFDFLTVPMRWIDMEPVEGKYSFAQTDRWIEWAVTKAKMPVHAGPLVDFRQCATPDWLYIWENDYETLRDLVFEHVQAVVTRYRRTIARWTVASGLHVNTNFRVSFEQIMDLTRMCVLLVRKLHPTAKIQLELTQPWGEYHASNRRSIPPYLYAEACLQGGLNVDAIALRTQMGNAEPGCATRDMLSFSSMLDKFAALEKPIAITAMGAPSVAIPPKPFLPRAGAAPEDPYEPGHWRSPWSEAAQAEWAAHALAIAASKPYVQSVCWHELSDGAVGKDGLPASPEMAGAGLLHASGTPKPAWQKIAEFRRATREGKMPAMR
jgi:hypothetical protein